MSISTNIKAIKTRVRCPTDLILMWILWGDIMSKPYRLEYCMICHKQLIVQNIDTRTGKELPCDTPYVCDSCKQKREKERRDNMSEYEKQCALMFVNYVTDSKCKRGRVIPCGICRAVYSDCEGYV